MVPDSIEGRGSTETNERLPGLTHPHSRMQGLPIAAFVLVIPGLLCQTTIPRTGSFKLTKVYRSIRYTKVDFYISFTPSQPDPTIETTMTHNYWATNRTPIPSEGVFVEPRENQIKGLLSSGILKKGMARISFNKTEFLEFENGYMGLPYQPIIMIGFPNRQYFILRLRVDFEWKVDEKKDVTTESTTLSHTLISFPRGDQLYFNTSSKRPSRAENNLMEFLIPKDFEKNADPNNSSRIHMSLFFINGCGETTSGYFQVKYKNLRLFFDSSRRRGDNGWGQMIQFETYHRIVTVKKDYTNISLPILYWCDGDRTDPNKFPQGFISFRRRAVFSNRKSVLDELTSKVILTFGYRGNPFGYPSDYGFVWEETTDSNDVKNCRYFANSCVIACKFVGANIANVTVGKYTEDEGYVPIHSETPRTFEPVKMSIRLGLSKKESNETYYCEMYYGYPEPVHTEKTTFDVMY